MRLGTGKGLGLMLPALCALGAIVGSVSASGGAPAELSSSLSRAQPQGGASAAAPTNIFIINGTPAANRLVAYLDPSGRFVLTTPEGITEPDGPAPECTQDSPTQVSCQPGYIGAVAGDLGAGDDSFTASVTLPILVGVSFPSGERPLLMGPGRDRVTAGLGGDLIGGGGGPDWLNGGGGADLVRGEAGRDTLNGGRSSDHLIGGGGADKLNGGAARDLCSGGGGIDTAKSCNATTKIP